MIESCIWKCYDYSGDGIDILEAIKNQPYSFFLDSGVNIYNLGRFSFLGSDPFLIYKTKREKPFNKLRQLLNKYKLSPIAGLPNFIGGAVGYFSYDLGSLFEKVASKAEDDLGLPECFFGFYDVLIIIDHLLQKLYIVSSGLPETNKALARKRADFRLKQTIKYVSQINPRFSNNHKPDFKFNRLDTFYIDSDRFVSNFQKQDYLSAVKKALDYIRKGDIYQVNLSQRFCITNPDLHYQDSDSRNLQIYKMLRQISPACFSAFLDCGDFKLLSSSPERFLHLKGRCVETRPMKGTRPRGSNDFEDRNLKAELLNSPKDKAELIMIVDLERNDLGKVCEYGSIKLKELRSLEAYSTVFQTTSTVQGTLHKDKDCIDLIKACFPGGSITGCPKIRAMQIIEELEPTKRSIYTGSLGYFSFTGDMDFNILIRTLLQKDNRIYFQVGGGIVMDSNPLSEYEETLVKAKALFHCLNSSILEKASV